MTKTEYAKAGSQRWLQVTVNQYPEIINRSLGFGSTDSITWKSPLASENYRERRDLEVFKALGIGNLEKRPLEEFWTRRGPVWDGLAKTSSGEFLFVEAKAHIPELVTGETKASPSSRKIIENSLREVQKAIAPRSKADWTRLFYQYTNRLAFLFLLRKLNNIPAHLVNVYFINAKDVDGPTTKEEWEGALKLMHSQLGTNNHSLKEYVHDVFIDVNLLKTNGAIVMISKFYKDENGYEKWLLENKQGYVFNHFGTVEMNKMHKATCYTLHTASHQGARTNYEKICSKNYKEVEQEANRVTRNEWSKCKVCF